MHPMLREVYLFYCGSECWYFPHQQPGCAIGYYPSAVPQPILPEGYPPIYLREPVEWPAAMELNAALRNVFQRDLILVLIPPPIHHARLARRLAARHHWLRGLLRRIYTHWSLSVDIQPTLPLGLVDPPDNGSVRPNGYPGSCA